MSDPLPAKVTTWSHYKHMHTSHSIRAHAIYKGHLHEMKDRVLDREQTKQDKSWGGFRIFRHLQCSIISRFWKCWDCINKLFFHRQY